MRILHVAIIALLMAALAVYWAPGADRASAAAPGWLEGWTYRIPLTIDRTRVPGSLSDFPVLVHLSAASGTNSADVSSIFTVLGSGARKIAVTTADGTTQCNVEIARWDSAGRQAYLWVKVPSVTSAMDTYLYLYYDKAQADNTVFVGPTGSTPAQGVWDDSFVAVLHLAQAGDGTEGEFKDSTRYGHDGQGGSGLGYGTPTLTTNGAPMGTAQVFNGSNSYISIPDADDFSVTATNNLTVSAWMSPATVDQPTSTDHYTRWLGKSLLNWNEWQFVYYDQSFSSRSQWISYYNYSPRDGDSGGLGAGDYSRGNFPANSWVYVTGTSTCSSPAQGIEYIYRNAAAQSGNADSWRQYGINYANGPAPVTIGTGRLGTGNWWSGRIGEVRVSNVVRSAAWIAASYYSESDALVSYGYLQGSETTASPSVITGPAAGVTAFAAFISGDLTSLGTAGAVSLGFRYGTTADYGSSIAGVPSSASGNGPFIAALSGLTPGTTYHYQAVAVGDGAAYGADQTFTTADSSGGGSSSTFGLDEGDAVYASSMLNAQRFQNTAGTGTLSKLELLISDTAASGSIMLGIYEDNNGVLGGLLLDAGSVAAADGWTGIGGLDLEVAAGAYYWLAYLPQNRAGIAYQSTGMPANSHSTYAYSFGPLPQSLGAGEVNNTPFVMRATVSRKTVPPSVSTGEASEVTASGATLRGDLTGLGTAGAVTMSFEYGLTESYGDNIDGVPDGLTGPGVFSADLSGLAAGSTYHYRAVATGDRTAYGDDRTFTTQSSMDATPASQTPALTPTGTAPPSLQTGSPATTPGAAQGHSSFWLWAALVSLALAASSAGLVAYVRAANQPRGRPLDDR